MADRKTTMEIQTDAMHTRLYDPECERAVLGTVMLDNASLALIEDVVRPADFHNPVHGLLYETMLSLHARQRPIDVVTLAEDLRGRERLNTIGGAQYLGELTDAMATTAHVESHAQILADLAVRRRMVVAAQEMIARAMGGGSGGTAEFIADSMTKLETASRRSGGGKMRTYREVVASTMERMAATGDKAPVRVKTGLTDVDMILGGLKGGWLYVVGARPAMGKSAWALLLAHKAAEDRRGVVMVFGLEMEPEENAARWAATVSNTDGNAVMEGRACDEDFEAFGNALVDCEDLPVLWNATDDLSIDDIGAICVRQTFTTPVTMVVIDYLTLLRMNPDAERHDLAVQDVSRKSKLLAKRLGCPVVLLSQLNRKCEERGDKRPLLSDLRDGGAIEQDANCVIGLYRDEVYHKDTDDKGVAEIIVLKHRGGPTGTARVGWIPSRTSFVNLQTDDGTPTVTYSSRNRGGRRNGAPQPTPPARQLAAPSEHTSDGCDPWAGGEGLPMEDNPPVFPGEQTSMLDD